MFSERTFDPFIHLKFRRSMSLAISNPPFLNRLKIKIGPFTDSNIIILILVPFTKKLALLVVASGRHSRSQKYMFSDSNEILWT